MKRALFWTLLALAVVVVLFVATWLTIPGGDNEAENLTKGRWETGRLTYPARLFRSGLVERFVVGCDPSYRVPQQICNEPFAVYRQVNLHTVKQRVVIFFGGLALVIVLVGVAFGALRRKPAAKSDYVATPPPAAPPPAVPPPDGPGSA